MIAQFFVYVETPQGMEVYDYTDEQTALHVLFQFTIKGFRAHLVHA